MSLQLTSSGTILRNGTYGSGAGASLVTAKNEEKTGQFNLDSSVDGGQDSGKTVKQPKDIVKTANTTRVASPADLLTDKEKEMVNELKARDKEVRAHEQNHKAVAGNLAKGPIQYTFQRGPDGKKYAIGGEIKIDMTPIPDDPEATARKAQKIISASLAAAEPSPADRQVAARAAQMLSDAQRQMMQQQQGGQKTQEHYTQEILVEEQKETKQDKDEVRKDNYVLAKEDIPFEFTEIVGGSATIIGSGGSEILGLIQAEQNQSKTNLPDAYSSSVLKSDPERVNINQFVDVEGMVSTSGLLPVGNRIDTIV